MVKVCFVKRWMYNDVKSDIKSLYIFGDNNVKKGCKGQAIIRYLYNACGIPTKIYPSYDDEAYYSDNCYENNCNRIDESINIIKNKLEKNVYDRLILPEDGLGTGLAELPRKAPRTYNYLVKKIYELVEEIDIEGIKTLELLRGYRKNKDSTTS